MEQGILQNTFLDLFFGKQNGFAEHYFTAFSKPLILIVLKSLDLRDKRCGFKLISTSCLMFTLSISLLDPQKSQFFHLQKGGSNFCCASESLSGYQEVNSMKFIKLKALCFTIRATEM